MCSYGLHSYGLHSYGLHSDGLHSYQVSTRLSSACAPELHALVGSTDDAAQQWFDGLGWWPMVCDEVAAVSSSFRSHTAVLFQPFHLENQAHLLLDNILPIFDLLHELSGTTTIEQRQVMLIVVDTEPQPLARLREAVKAVLSDRPVPAAHSTAAVYRP